jgi:hypothetical protein
VRVDVNTIVVPEGGELPSDDELAAMEAEERAEQAADAPSLDEQELEVLLADEETAEPAEEAEPLAAEAEPPAAEAEPRDEPEAAPEPEEPEATAETEETEETEETA